MTHSDTIARIKASPRFRAAVNMLKSQHERSIEETIALAQIPAPPFQEEVRGKAFIGLLREEGLDDVEQDDEGNVMGLRRGHGEGLIAVSAHLDTVFPAGTDLTVRRDGDRICAPGIGDDTRGLATLIGYLRAMNAAGIETGKDMLFVATVGEEGVGNLRGVRHLFANGRYRDRIEAFVTIDGPVPQDELIISSAGCKRYRLTLRGPGGHSFMDFGTVNPMYALGSVLAGLAALAVPAEPKTTYSAGVVKGGTSVNVIPDAVQLEVDLRSASANELVLLEQAFLALVDGAVTSENARGRGTITTELELTGDRPAGVGDGSSDLVRYATEALLAEGLSPRHVAASCDASIPISLGIPAILSGWGEGGGMHTTGEWMDARWEAAARHVVPGLTTILAIAGADLG